MKSTTQEIRGRLYVVFDELFHPDGESSSRGVKLLAKWVVCPRCDGNGAHTNPAIDGHGITREEMDELGPEFEEDYFAGVYDVTCHECKGRRVVPEIDREENPADLLALYDYTVEEDAAYAAMVAAERRMGA